MCIDPRCLLHTSGTARDIRSPTGIEPPPADPSSMSRRVPSAPGSHACAPASQERWRASKRPASRRIRRGCGHPLRGSPARSGRGRAGSPRRFRTGADTATSWRAPSASASTPSISRRPPPLRSCGPGPRATSRGRRASRPTIGAPSRCRGPGRRRRRRRAPRPARWAARAERSAEGPRARPGRPVGEGGPARSRAPRQRRPDQLRPTAKAAGECWST